MKTLRLVQILDTKVAGYWDGGSKKEFHWTLHDKIVEGEKWCRVGSWDANYFFPVRQGKTEKQTLGNARRALALRAKNNGMRCSFEYRPY